MGERLDKVRALAAQLEPEWGEEQIDSTLRGVQRGLRRRHVARGVAWTLGVLLLLALPAAVTLSRWGGAGASLVELHAPLRLDDGSTVTPLTADAEIVAAEVSPRAATVRLPSGGARFNVVKASGRRFRVDAGAVQVEVLGTEFDVRHGAGERVDVVVLRGRVRVSWTGGETVLEPGQQGSFPPVVPAPAVAPPPLPAAPVATAADWRALARQGSFTAAHEALAAGAPIEDSVDDQLLAADVARLSGNDQEAVPYLLRGLRAAESLRDGRAPLAAFTLGRLLSEKLDRPREAAAAFQRAREAAPDGPIAADALAREIEALQRAGDAAAAAEKRTLFRERYPDRRP